MNGARGVLGVATALVAAGCTTILGIHDVPNPDGGAGQDATIDHLEGDSGTSSDTPVDAHNEASDSAGVCAPGTQRCVGDQTQLCNDQSQWQDATLCDGGYCNGAGICGVCATGSQQCVGNTPEACDAGGWQMQAPCPVLCTSGACTGACSPGTNNCNGDTPQRCDDAGQWQNLAACAQPMPTCTDAGCICTEVNCGSVCTNTSNDTSNCGACGHACSSTHASATSCSGGTCAPTCLSGYQNCSTPAAPSADNGCECAGTGCCGSTCQDSHDDGIGQLFFDCNPGVTSASALDACAAWATFKGMSVAGCQNCTAYGLVCYGTQFCWGYGSAVSGNVYGPGSTGCMMQTATPFATWN